MTLVSCASCNKEFKVAPVRLKSKFLTCSISCCSEYKKNINTTKVKVPCIICLKEIRLKKSQVEKRKQASTCSRECRGKYLKTLYMGIQNPNSNHYPDEIHKYFHQKIIDLKSRAKKNNLEFNLTKEDLIDCYERQNRKCFYSDVEMKLVSENFNTHGQADLDVLSVDRAISSIGYIKGNIFLCCNSINKLKGNSDFITFLKFWSKISKKDIYFL